MTDNIFLMAFIIILIAVGVLLVLAEIFLIPGIGVAGILGLISLGGSCFYAFSEFGSTTGVIVTLVNSILVVGLTVYLMRAKTWKKLALKTHIDSKVNAFDETKLAVGDRGRTLTRLAPMGMAIINDVKYEVKTLEGIIDAGTEVEVAMLEDNKVYVKRLEVDY